MESILTTDPSLVTEEERLERPVELLKDLISAAEDLPVRASLEVDL